jgi:hypothetical protein
MLWLSGIPVGKRPSLKKAPTSILGRSLLTFASDTFYARLGFGNELLPFMDPQ